MGTAEDPKATTTYRVMLAVVIILGVLIVLALGALVVGGIVKAAHRGAAATVAAPLQAEAALPAGARITSAQVSGNRLVIVFHDTQGDGVEIVDTDTGKAVAVITPQRPAK